MTRPSSHEPADERPVRVDALTAYVAAVLRACGVSRGDARTSARVLVQADQRGIPSHGVARLPMYVAGLRRGSLVARPSTVVLARRGVVELWDAGHGLGHPVASHAMERAIRLARRGGVGVVSVRSSGHFGIAAAYVVQARRVGFIGLALSNTDALVAPFGSARAMLGTNPIAVGAPGRSGPGFLLDMATSVVTGGRLEVARRRGERIPAGWAIDASGRPSHDPDALGLGVGGALLPLGGADRAHGGHKGSALAAVVDLLTGVLSGGAHTLGVRSLYAESEPTSVSHLLLALDPGAIGEPAAFVSRVDEWTAAFRSLPPLPGVSEVLVAGEPESRAEARNHELVPLDDATRAKLATLANDFGLGTAWRRAAGR